MFPRLLSEPSNEFGMDFTVLNPTAGLGIPFHPIDETRRATCRAFNRFIAEFFEEFSDRMTPAAVIPMHTPEEAIEELEYVVKQLGLKVASLRSMIPRSQTAPNGSGATSYNDWIADFSEIGEGGIWYDVLGIDSAYN